MPELPEVEFARRCLRRWASGKRIARVECDPKARRIFRPAEPAQVARTLKGARVTEIARLGKNLLFTLHKGGAPLGLLSHLGMTGKWLRTAAGDHSPSHSRVRFLLDDGLVLHYQDPRLFGRLRLVPEARFEEVRELGALGPDPLRGIEESRLGSALGKTRLPVKVKLLDQRLLPGVGNIHAAEACLRAGIDPRRPARTLSRTEVRRLAVGVLASFRAALAAEKGPKITYIEEGGLNPFLVYGREGETCPRCRKTKIRRIMQAGRSTYFCPHCQR